MDSKSSAMVVNFAPSPELELLGSTARSFLEDNFEMDKLRKLVEEDGGFSREMWTEIAQLGWPGLAVAEEYGGAGYGWVELVVLAEELGRAVAPGPFLSSMVLATEAVKAVAYDRQLSLWLPKLAGGELVGALAVFEQPDGWSVSKIDTIAQQDGAGWRLEGRKSFVIEAGISDIMVLSAQIPGGGIGLFVVENPIEGMKLTETPAMDSTRRLFDVSLEDVWVPADRLLGEGSAEKDLEQVLRLGSLFLAAEQVGGAQRCMEMSVEYAKSRFQFGRPIGSYQAVKHMCALMLVDVEHARSTVQYAARVVDQSQEFLVAAPMAASAASEAYVSVAGDNIQVHGGIGFTWEHHAHMYLKRAKSSALLLGDPRYHRSNLGDTLGF